MSNYSKMPKDYYNLTTGNYDSSIKSINKWKLGDVIYANQLNAIEGKLDEISLGLPDLISTANFSLVLLKPYNKIWITLPGEISFAEGHEFDSLRDLIAPAYIAGNNYNIGDYVLYTSTDSNNYTIYTLFRCKEAITNAPSKIDTNKWDNIKAVQPIINNYNSIQLMQLILKDFPMALLGSQELNLSSDGYEIIGATIAGKGNQYNRTFNVGNPYSSYKILRKSAWKQIIITTYLNIKSFVSFVTEDFPTTFTSNAPVCFAEGETDRHEIKENKTEIFNIPQDAAYIIIAKISQQNVNATPKQVLVCNRLDKKIDEITNTINNITSSLGLEYNPQLTYSEGAFCIYNNKLYCCKSEITSPIPWSGNQNWVETTISENLTELLTDISSCGNILTSVTTYNNIQDMLILSCGKEKLINYIGDSYTEYNDNDTEGFNGNVYRLGFQFTINGTSNISPNNTNIKIILSSLTLLYYTVNYQNTQNTGLELLNGHKYELRVRHLSGSVTSLSTSGITNKTPYCKFIKASNGTSIGINYFDLRTNEYVAQLDFNSSEINDKVHFALFVNRTNANPAEGHNYGALFNQYKILAILKDVTYRDKWLNNIAPVESSPLINGYAKEELLIYCGNLYLTVTSLTAGTAITSGSNGAINTSKIKLTSIALQLAKINNKLNT